MGGDPVRAGFATSLARPGGNITGVSGWNDVGIWEKRLQLLKEVARSASKVGFLNVQIINPQQFQQQLREISQRLQMTIIDVSLKAATTSEVQRAFAEIVVKRPDAIIVDSDGSLIPYRQLVVELVEKSRLPAIYPWREYAEVGGLIAYAADLPELARRIADDVHQILNGAKPADIPIYRPSKFELVVNLKAAKVLGLTFPSALLAEADEVIE
jgi:putative tryptophan/tyrosine transport system substrate-binding protein